MRLSVSVSVSVLAFTRGRQLPGRWRWVASTSSGTTRLIVSLDLGGVPTVDRVCRSSAAGSLVSRMPMEGHHPVSARGRAQRRWMPRQCFGLPPGPGDRSSLACSPRWRFRTGGVVLSPRRGGDVGRGHEHSHPRRHRGEGAPTVPAMFAGAGCSRGHRPALPIGPIIRSAGMVLHGGRPCGRRRGERDVVLGL